MELNMAWSCTTDLRDVDRRGANIPARKWDADLRRIPDAMAYKKDVLTYFENLEQNLRDGIGLLLWGPYRSGKTSIACAIAKEVLRHYNSAFFLETAFLMDIWMGRPTVGGEDAKRRLLRCHLLILDDAGQEHGKEYTHAVVDTVIRHRAEEMGATILTTNLTLENLKKEYGDKFMSIVKTCLHPIRVEGHDWGEGRNVERQFGG